MSTTFNLKTHLTKTASMAYEGSQGYFLAQQRAWMNCIKCKQTDGKSAQESWQGCFDEFQKGDRKLSWVQNYAGDVVESVNKGINTSASLDYSAEILKFASEGMAIGAAVTKALQHKLAQAEMPASTDTLPDAASANDENPVEKEYVIRGFNKTTRKWAYYGKDSTTDNVIPSDLASAKRFSKDEAMMTTKQIYEKTGASFTPAKANEGDWTKF